MATPDGERSFQARWLVDASGRAGLIRRRLNLTRPVGHIANACWFRLRNCVRIDEWSDDLAVEGAVSQASMRWHSTTHLMGRGYWVWLIPLGSGGISIGIVVDETVHPWHRLNRFERAMEWLHEFEPQCADYMEKERDNVEDFLALRHFAHGCERVYSPDRWLLTGEAGVFTDPFYSPGSDFIAMGNELITDLIMRDRRGEDISARIEQHNNSYLRLFEALPQALRRAIPVDGQRAGHDRQSRRGTTRATGRSRRCCIFSAASPMPRSWRRSISRCGDSSCCTRACRRSCANGTSSTPRSIGRGYTNVMLRPGAEAPSGGARGAADGRRDAAREDSGQFRAARALCAGAAAHRVRRPS